MLQQFLLEISNHEPFNLFGIYLNVFVVVITFIIYKVYS
jgi:hypothetical protein